MKCFSLINKVATSFLAICAFVMAGCTSGEEFETVQNEVPAGFEKVYTDAKCSFFKADMVTRNADGATGIITLVDNPNLKICTYDNADGAHEGYPYKAIFYNDGAEVLEVYTNVTETEGGYLFSFDCVDGDMDTVFLPTEITRAAPSAKGKTVDCISDAYMNDGWASAFAWAATAVCWEVAVAIAADCLMKNF